MVSGAADFSSPDDPKLTSAKDAGWSCCFDPALVIGFNIPRGPAGYPEIGSTAVAMVKSILFNFLLKAVLIALIALILYGVVPDLVIILIFFVVWRFASLAAEALRKPVSAEQRNTILDGLTRQFEMLATEERTRQAAALKLGPHFTAREMAQAQLDRVAKNYRPPRSKRELAAEALGVIGYAVLIPLDIALCTSDIFSLRASQHWGWEGAIVVAFSLGLYAWPYRAWRLPDSSDLRIWWWVVPFALGLLVLNHAVQTRHPYLNPFNPDRDQLAAERVLSLKNNIVAGAYADWVLRYARELDERGETQQAIHFYREGLRLDANDRTAAERLAQLEARSGGAVESQTEPPSSAPYWTAAKPVVKQPRHSIDTQLENVESCTIVVVPVGDVSDDILDSVGYVIHTELKLPVYISPNPVPLPDYTRKRGLAVAPQWDLGSLVGAFNNSTQNFPRAPIKYLLVTPVDIYMQDANYVFSASANWGAVLSFARYGGPEVSDTQLRQRTAKQALCALLKSFDVPASTDLNCVTSYTRNLAEFDAKGNLPDAETMKLFEQALGGLNQKWQVQKAKPRASD